MEPTTQDHEHWTHEEVITSVRRALVAELGIEDSSLAWGFLALPVGHRVRASGVRASLSRFAADQISQVLQGAGYGGYNEIADEVALNLPAVIALPGSRQLPVLWSLSLKLGPFVLDMAKRGVGAVAADFLHLKSPALDEITRRLMQTPPTFEGWNHLGPADIARAFQPHPPRISDRKELYQRIRLACAHAVERTLLDQLALRNPGFVDYLQCFPLARATKRKVIAWLGPTNSGKTHNAILALSAAPSGMYLGPLRLLALEQRDRVVELGRSCSLVTGEEREETSPTHSARTVEMTDFSRRFEVCVLDEMQLAFDRDRGWPWVAAYCGVATKSLIVTGPVSAEPVIRRLADICGDEIEIKHLERHGTLEYEGVLDWRRVPPRSAVIGFSRAMVLELKAMFESRGSRVSVIYGGLSPDVRRAEARRFREGASDIVCATDAIGLGLNLPLDRVIFYETDKFDGELNRALTPAELLQIAGRAGRGPGAAGLVAAFSIRDGRRLANALASPQTAPPLDRLPAAPTAMHVRAIADHLNADRLTSVLEFFRTRLTFPGGSFFPEVQEDVFAAAALVDTFAPSLPFEQRYALACAPVDLDGHLFRSAFAEWLEALERGNTVNFPRRVETGGGLEALEDTLKLTTLYRWLALKFPEAFTDLSYVGQICREATEQAQSILRGNWGKQGFARHECVRCGRALLPSSSHRTCRDCHTEGFG